MSSPMRKHGFNDRTHTHGRERKLSEPKKGGAGGKGVWGKEGSELSASTDSDIRDPNYDSAEGDDDGPPVIRPLDAFKQQAGAILKEYFVSGDVEEVARALNDLDRSQYHHEFVKLIISKSMDENGRERELASCLLSHLYPNNISYDKFVEGFTVLLERIEDLRLDIPSAPEYLSMFLARAVIDDLLPPAFLSPDSADVELAKETLNKAKSLIQGKGASKRIAQIWGPGGAQSVKHYKERSQSILEEYLSHTDIAEADRAVRELKVESFHWHVVKKAVLLALDHKEANQEKLVKLLATFNRSGLISEDHFVAGFKRCVDMLDDIELDTPNAREGFRHFVQKSTAAGYLPASFEADNKEAMEAKKKAK